MGVLISILNQSTVFGIKTYCFCLFVCEDGHLVSIEDPLEQSFIQNTIKVFEDNQNSFWIGLYKTHKGTVTASALS